MAITVGALVNGSTALQVLASQPLPGALAFRVSRIVNKLAPELQAYNKARLDIFKKYGDLNTEKNEYKLREGEDTEKANAELKDLWEAEVPVEFKPLPLSTLDHIEISAELINSANWLFEEEKE